MPEPPEGFAQRPTEEIKLDAGFLHDVKQVAPKRQRPVLRYVLLAAILTAAAAIGLRFLQRHHMEAPTPPATASATATATVTATATASVTATATVTVTATATATSPRIRRRHH